MLSLSSLAGWEEAVLASINAASGTPDERDRQIERSGMYGEYPAILNAYVELFDDDDSRLEAVKRALFLTWRSAMFPPDVTGMAPLPDSVTRVVLERVDAAIRADEADGELAWMLAWYREDGAVALELLGATPRVMRWQADLEPDAWRGAGVSAESMRRRGQMGMYWATLAAGTP